MEKLCQNCGMPLFNNLQPGLLVTSFNKKSCSCDYKGGELTQSGKNFKTTQSSRIEKMKKEGMPKFLKWLSARGASRF